MHDTICDSDPRNEPKEVEAEETPTHRVHLRDRCAASNEELCAENRQSDGVDHYKKSA